MFLQWLLKSPAEVIIYILLSSKDNLNIMEGFLLPRLHLGTNTGVLDGAFFQPCQEEIKLEPLHLSQAWILKLNKTPLWVNGAFCSHLLSLGWGSVLWKLKSSSDPFPYFLYHFCLAKRKYN